MESLAQSNIFFLISSVSSIITTVLLAIFLVYLIRIARDVHKITSSLRAGVEQSEALIGSIFGFIKDTVLGVLFGSPSSSPKKRRATAKEKESSD